MSVLNIKGLYKQYNGRMILKNCDFHVDINECIVILGKSGSGKSTILNCIADFTPYDCKQRSFKGKLGYMFQTPELFPWLTIEENIGFPAIEEIDKERISRYCNMFGLSGYDNYMPKQLSFGMQQRVSLARALIQKPDLLLLDEPFSSLDYFLKLKMYQILLQIQAMHQTSMILVTHDLQEAICLGDRIYILDHNTHELKEVLKVNIKKDEDLQFMDQSAAIMLKQILKEKCSAM